MATFRLVFPPVRVAIIMDLVILMDTGRTNITIARGPTTGITIDRILTIQNTVDMAIGGTISTTAAIVIKNTVTTVIVAMANTVKVLENPLV